MMRGTIIGGEDSRWATHYGSFVFPDLTFDLGDLPAAYSLTLRTDDGPHHCLPPGGGVFLGSLVDADGDGQESGAAQGDDTDGSDDEDGVTPVNTPWQDGVDGAAVQVQVGGSGCLNAWIDWNADNDFLDSLEHIINDASVTVETSPVFTFEVPADTFNGLGEIEP